MARIFLTFLIERTSLKRRSARQTPRRSGKVTCAPKKRLHMSMMISTTEMATTKTSNQFIQSRLNTLPSAMPLRIDSTMKMMVSTMFIEKRKNQSPLGM